MTKTQAHPSDVLRFDPEKHQFWRGPKRIPGVSEILTKVGLSKDFKGVDPFYRDRGIATHKAIELYLQGILDPTSLDPAIRPQFEAFLGYWDKHMDEKIIALEKPMADNLEFAGIPDLVTEKAVYDWKASKSHDRVADLQGQAYKHLVEKNLNQTLPFIVVELHDDSTSEVFDYGSKSNEWPSVLTLYRWRLGKHEE